MQFYKIQHTSGIIKAVGGPTTPDIDGLENIILPAHECGDVMNRKDFYIIDVDQCVLKSATELDQVRLDEKIKNIVEIVLKNTPSVIANFTYNSVTYNLTQDVINQLNDIYNLIRTKQELSEDPATLFPMEIALGFGNREEITQTINTISTFLNVYKSVQQHIHDKRDVEMRQLVNQVKNMTLEELNNWVDPR